MDRSLKFCIKEVKGLYYLCSENKGADQLRGYREADLRLCFRICKNPVFSRRGSYYTRHNMFGFSDRWMLIAYCCMKVHVVQKAQQPPVYSAFHVTLLLYESSAESSCIFCSCRSFLHYFHLSINNHLSIVIFMSTEWMATLIRFICNVTFISMTHLFIN